MEQILAAAPVPGSPVPRGGGGGGGAGGGNPCCPACGEPASGLLTTFGWGSEWHCAACDVLWLPGSSPPPGPVPGPVYRRLMSERDAWMRRAREAEREIAGEEQAAAAAAAHPGSTPDPPEEGEAAAADCEGNRCEPVRLPGGWWCRGCNKSLRLVRLSHPSGREEEK